MTVKEHEWYRLVRETGAGKLEWLGMTWHRYARWYEPAQRSKEVIRGPFRTPERARAVFVEEVERRLAKGYEWASKERFGRGARAHAPAAAKASKPWTKGKGKGSAWPAKVPGPERARVRAILEGAGLAHRADDIMTLARPAIRFALKTAKAPGVITRFGGAPDLPAGFAWPMNGKIPLAFVAQFRLDELAKLDLERRLPRSGVLSVFVHASPSSDDYGETGRLFYFPDRGELVHTRPPHPAREDGRPARTAMATARIALTLPALHEKPYASLRLTADEEARYDEKVLPAVRQTRTTPAQPGAHQLLGWPDVLTPSRCELLGMIDSDRRFGFEIGDVETLRLWITPKRLAARDFTRTHFTIQAD